MNKLSIGVVLLIVIGFFSCNTDVDVNADPSDITVVYGMLDPLDTVHYIKINKAFLGEGNALDLANDASHFNYADGELSVTVDGNGKVHTLTRVTNEIPKDAGVFDNTTNVLYKFTEPLINRDSVYTLKIENTQIDKEITAKTNIVDSIKISVPQTFEFWNGTNKYLNEDCFVSLGDNIGRVQVWFVFNYIEHYTNGKDSLPVKLRINLGEQKTTSSANNMLTFTIKGNSIFENIIANVSDPINIPHFSHRELDLASIESSFGGTELSTYMEANAPSTTVNQDKPNYTNITNGIGIFSSRSKHEFKSAFNPAARMNYYTFTIAKLSELGLGFCWATGSTATAPCP